MKKVLFLSSLFLSSTVFGALPPLVQSTRELQAVLANSSMQNNLDSGELIQEIIRTEGGYLIVTNRHMMKVDVKYLPSGIGPVKFDLEFQEPVDLNR